MRVSVAAAICLSVIGLSGAAEVQAAIKRQTNIPAQGLGPALQTLAKERNFQLVYVSEEINDVRTAGAVGELTSEEALQRLLIGTGLTFRYLDEETVTIVPVGGSSASSTSSATPSSPATQAKEKGFWSRFRLAQAESASKADERTSSEEQGPSENAEESSQKRIALEEIIVTGTNIRGVYPASSPVDIYTAEDIARTGATTTEQFISKLPQNLGTRTQYASGYRGDAANLEAVTSVDLRGLGVGTTLTLLNGRRLALASSGQAADVSLIPVSAIERVEVLTDGASAIYGADAIGGVVNFVLRDDFEGAESRLVYGGVTSGGLRQFNGTQTFGSNWGSGHVLASYDYFDTSPLLRADRSFAAASGEGTLTPDERRHGALVTLGQDLGDRVSLSGDLALSRRDVNTSYHSVFSADPLSSSNGHSETRQYFANMSAAYRIGAALNGSLLASYSEVDVDTVETQLTGSGAVALISPRDTNHSALDVTAMLDGSLFDLAAGAVRFSLGGGYLEEDYVGVTPRGIFSSRRLGRATTYVFGELFAPLVGEERNVPFVHRLELSLAARYTRYDDASRPATATNEFGDNTSPKIGVLWAPTPSLSLRATLGESFRAPTLTEIDPSTTGNFLQVGPVAGVPDSTWLILQLGPATDLTPEVSETFTLGFDLRPAAHPGFHLGATYFNMDYQDRVAAGDPTFGLGARTSPQNHPQVIFQPASATQIEEYLRAAPIRVNRTMIGLSDLQEAAIQLFALSPNFWIIDNRLRNLSLSKLDGFDLSVSNRFATSWGEVDMGVQMTRIFDYRQQVTESSPVIAMVDVVTLPVDLRGRAYAGLTRGGFAATIGVNYVDNYANPFALGGPQTVASWATVDLSAAYEFKASAGLFNGVRLNLSVQNLFDKDPPFVQSGGGGGALQQPVAFDPANANPVNRLIVLGVSKKW